MKHALNQRFRVDDVGYALIRLWKSEGQSYSKIAQRLNVSKSTVCRHLKQQHAPSKRAKVERRTPPVLKRRRMLAKSLALKSQVTYGSRGRYGNVNPIVIRRRVFPSVSFIGRHLRRLGYTMSNSAVRRDLIRSGLKAKRKATGPRRHETDTSLRLLMSRRWLRSSNLGGFLFSDEKMCDINDHGTMYEWCRPGQQPMHRERDRFAPRVHVWGLIGVGVKCLVFLPEGGINHTTYIRRCLTPHRHILAAPGRTFVQDGARIHSCEKTTAYLQRAKVTVASWPPRSPDLNPVESLWGRIQALVSNRGPTSKEELQVFWKEAWDAISQEEIDRTVLSFRDRLRECVRQRGETIMSW